MRNAARYIAAPIAVFLLLFTGIARAMDNPRVDDKAGFFSSDAVSKANETIAQIKRDHGKDLFIETLPAIPEEHRSQYQPEQRQQFFTKLADQRAAAAKVDGVIVLITREPAFIQVRVGKNTIQQAFIQRDADQFQSILQSAFRTKEFDQGLLTAVQHARDTFAQSTPRKSGATAAPATPSARESSSPPAPAPGPSGRTSPAPAPTRSPLGGMTSWICVGVAVLLVFFMFRAMRARSAQYIPGQGRYGAPGDPNMPPGQQQYGGYPQAQGGGMGRGLLGGLLGGALGGYAYDRFMRRPNDSGGHSDPGALGGGAGGSSDSPADTSDFGSGGGGGSGGDFGGGGGDFGGGGDGGGGGGDF